MNISRENYEAIAIDYLDGNLDKHSKDAFEAFLLEHPDIAHEIELLSGVSFNLKEELEAPELPKEMLFKDSTLVETDGGDVLDDICIDIIEGAYEDEQKKRIESKIEEHTRSRKRLEAYRKTIAIPDYSIQYPEKSSLFRQQRNGLFQRRTWHYALMGAAASLLIMVGVHQLTNDDSITQLAEPTVVAETNEISPGSEGNTEGQKTGNAIAVNTEQPEKKGDDKQEPKKSAKEGRQKQKASAKEGEKKSGKDATLSHPVIKIGTEEPVILAKANKVEVSLEAPKQQYAELASVDFVKQEFQPVTLPKDNSLGNVLALNINKFVFQKDPKSPESRKLSMWDVADLGITGVNRIVGTNMELERKYNEQGEVVKLAFYSKKFSYQKKSNN